jgi:energy-coupling factor transport system permease protein
MLAAISLAVLTYNPLYHILLLGALILLAQKHEIAVSKTLKAGVCFGMPILLINILLVHHGGHVITSIPKYISFLGQAIPLYGIAGPITWESIAAALIFMLILINTLLIFLVYNSVTSPDGILHIIPKAFSNSTLLVAIALRFTPTLTSDVRAITDAQRCRGLKMNEGGVLNRLSAAVSLIVPTIVNSLERSYSLAEALEARGYSRDRTTFYTESWTREDKMLIILYALSVFYLLVMRFTGSLSYWNAMSPYGGALHVDFAVGWIIGMLIVP